MGEAKTVTIAKSAPSVCYLRYDLISTPRFNYTIPSVSGAILFSSFVFPIGLIYSFITCREMCLRGSSKRAQMRAKQRPITIRGAVCAGLVVLHMRFSSFLITERTLHLLFRYAIRRELYCVGSYLSPFAQAKRGVILLLLIGTLKAKRGTHFPFCLFVIRCFPYFGSRNSSFYILTFHHSLVCKGKCVCEEIERKSGCKSSGASIFSRGHLRRTSDFAHGLFISSNDGTYQTITLSLFNSGRVV